MGVSIGYDGNNAIGTYHDPLLTPNLSDKIGGDSNLFTDIHSHRNTRGPSDFTVGGQKLGDKNSPDSSRIPRFIYYLGSPSENEGTLYKYGVGTMTPRKIDNYGDYKKKGTLYQYFRRYEKR